MGDIAMVTGASGGLGTALVAAFVARGDSVHAVARDAAGTDALVETYGAAVTPHACDLTDPAAVAAMWTSIDGTGSIPRWLVNAAGGYGAGTVEESSVEDVRFQQELNLGTAWWSCREAVPRMKVNGGCIVNVSSRAGLLGSAEAASYAVAKAAVIRLTEVLSDELLETTLRVNAIVPAIIDTAANRASLPESASAKAVPAEAIADVVTFLCSEAAAPITGAAIPVGGRFPKPWRT